MRLSKFLSLSVAMSRNQAKFFIRKGRLSVDGQVVTDPEFELTESNSVVFDGKPISVAGFRYIVLHKPASLACVARGAEQPSVLGLLADEVGDRFYYFANVLGVDTTGLVLISDDARWTQRIKRRVAKKPRVFAASLAASVSLSEFESARERVLASSDAATVTLHDVQRLDDRRLQFTVGHTGTESIFACFEGAGLALESLHLLQLGRLQLDDLPDGAYRELAEDDVKI